MFNVYGTGGIGTGLFFKLLTNNPLTRDESRPAHLTDCRDYCKGHIILHYIARLTDANVYAVGMVGDDTTGARLVDEMQNAGIDTRCVGISQDAPTMFAACFQYPDGAGGNITAVNSACGLVTPKYIDECLDQLPTGNTGVYIAAPEVPLEARIRLLEIGKRRGGLTAASFLAEEARAFAESGGFGLSDVIAINRDEAAAVAQLGGFGMPDVVVNDENNYASGSRTDTAGERLAEAAAQIIASTNPTVKLIITMGADGAYIYESGVKTHIPCESVRVASTAGAGDAFLAGTIAAMINGKNFTDAARYGSAVAALSVMSEHTIAENADAGSVDKFIRERGCDADVVS